MPEIASLIAPRPCLWEVGAKDPLIDATLADQALTRIRRAYRALQAEEHCTWTASTAATAGTGRLRIDCWIRC